MIADKTIHIQQKYIMLFLLLIPILQPKICTQYTIPTVLYAVMNLVEFAYLFLFCISLLICILVVFFDFQNYFSFIIVNLLGKDLTLSNRIYLWSRAVDIIFNSSILQILFGHGQVVRFVPNAGSLWNPHNALLASLYNSGIIGTVAFYLFLYKLGNNKYYSSLQQGMMIIVFTLMVMSITENYFEVAYVFVPFLLLRYADDVV